MKDTLTFSLMSTLFIELELTRSDAEMKRLNVIHWAIRELWQTNVRVHITNPPMDILDVGLEGF